MSQATAKLKLYLDADSGYECEEEHRITPEQWEKIQRVLHGTEIPHLITADTIKADDCKLCSGSIEICAKRPNGVACPLGARHGSS